MPCQDITELLEVTLDANDCLESYAFNKRTCGQGIGQASLLIDWLKGRPASYFLNAQAEAFLDEFDITDSLEEFLTLKHLFAIQGALEVLTGTAPGGLNDAFTAASIEFEDDFTVIRGEISIDIVTDKIKSCGGCGGCGTNKPRKSRKKKDRGTAVAG